MPQSTDVLCSLIERCLGGVPVVVNYAYIVRVKTLNLPLELKMCRY